MKSFLDKVMHRNQKKRRSFSLKIEMQNAAALTDEVISEAMTELADMIQRGEANLDTEGKVRYILGDVVLEGRMEIDTE
ncbi:MAG: hypothetical protein XE11_0863 [Methanomicrobiales archaeon 53_19]|jgi:hypothetical protein|uniref:hypothetical protein n=1 Tax=Methanocalculus sp. TaxID=2004547 RepID=UPI0007471784|nr:hypothetical protein [Methanocalculus sp.]KUK69917.1 MAG: hypothetical protein XD88_0965 [Methanocalculus sp. 52_23]KUL04002.1 MAG: hypothetical protein XE11_0863 [Methanomicrobiales archaeon 53_19]HIJ06745.1 hypothetical protein [Methanocalculus sp.]